MATREYRNKEKYDREHKFIDGVLFKWCTKCKNFHPMDEQYFYKYKNNSGDGFYPYCKKHLLENSKKWRENNRERYLELNKILNQDPERKKEIKRRKDEHRALGKQKEWQQKNKDKIVIYNEIRRNKNHTISKQEWVNCKKYFDYCCAYCGMAEEEHKTKFNQQFHKEHVDDQGEGDLSNCVPSCKSCNSEKHISTLDEWYNENNEKYDNKRYEKIIKWISSDFKTYILKNKKAI